MSNSKHYIWSAVGKFGTEILGFVGNVLIARALSPDDYGLIATLAIVTALAMNFSDAGFNDCLIRKRDSDKYDFGTVATYNIVVSTFIYALLFIFAPQIADFFHREELIGITRVLGLSIILKAFTLSGFVQLNKNLKFKQSSIIALLCSACSIGITYTMALCGMGYWALALQPVVVAMSNIVFLTIIAHWRPYFCFKWQRFKEMFAYSSNLLISYIITNIGNNIYSVIIGRFFKTSDLGYYNQAHKMQTVPTNGINAVMLTTSYPIIAKEADEKTRYDLYVNLFRKFNFIMTFLVFFLITASDLVFYLLLGEKWMPSSPLFQIFMLIGLSYPLMTINQNAIKIQGKSNIYRNLALLRTGLQIVALCICAPISLKAIVIGQVVASFVSVSFDMYFCGRTIGFTIGKQYKLWLSIIWEPLVVFIICLVISGFIDNMLLSRAIATVSFVLIFIILCAITNDTDFFYFLHNIKLTIKKLSNHE